MDKRNITGLRIKELRKASNLTQKELATILNLSSDSTVVSYEKGVSFPSHKVLYKLANYFKVSVDYLLGNESSIDSDTPNIAVDFDVKGLDKDDILEIKKHIEFIHWKKRNN